MTEKIRFHLDENVNLQIARALEKMEIEVSTSTTEPLRTATDEAQWSYVKREGRVLITHDSDFLRIASKDFNHPGILFCRKDERSLGEIIIECASVFNNFTPDEMKGKIEFI